MAYNANMNQAWQIGQSLFPSYYPGGAAPAAGTTTAAGTLAGAPARGYTTASGGIPAVPSPQTSQAAAVGGNIAALPQITGLAGDVNAFNLGEVLKQYQAGIPNYNAMTGQSSANITAALQGQVPSDVRNLIAQSAAERGIATGGAGSPNANAAYLRALGLTSLGQQQYGEQALTGAVARMPRTALYNPAADFVTPAAQQEAQYTANVLESAAVPQDAYNQALLAAQAGQRIGFGNARVGQSGTDWLMGLVNKYNPAGQTVPGMTSSTSSMGATPTFSNYAAYPAQDETPPAWAYGLQEDEYADLLGGY